MKKKKSLGRDILWVIILKVTLTLALWFWCFSTPMTKPKLAKATAQHVCDV